MTLRERAAAIATIAHPDRRETNGFVKSYAYDMLYLAVQEECKRCAKLVDLGCLGPPCCELGKSHARHCPQTLVAEIRKSGDL